MIDLIDECGQDLSDCGFETVKLARYGATSSKLFVDTQAKAKKLGFDRGHYFVVNAPMLSNLMPEHEDFLKDEISARLKFLFEKLMPFLTKI